MADDKLTLVARKIRRAHSSTHNYTCGQFTDANSNVFMECFEYAENRISLILLGPLSWAWSELPVLKYLISDAWGCSIVAVFQESCV